MVNSNKNEKLMRSSDESGQKMPKEFNVNGKLISMSELPLVAYALKCGHMGREYGIVKNDLLFCDTCGQTMRVKQILAT
jgi:hypothetical protein